MRTRITLFLLMLIVVTAGRLSAQDHSADRHVSGAIGPRSHGEKHPPALDVRPEQTHLIAPESFDPDYAREHQGILSAAHEFVGVSQLAMMQQPCTARQLHVAALKPVAPQISQHVPRG